MRIKQENVEKNMVTLKDIAAEAGVSITTVSNVVHHRKSRVSPELVENYSFDIAPSDHYRHDDQFAARQLCALLKLPDRVIEDMKKAF